MKHLTSKGCCFGDEGWKKKLSEMNLTQTSQSLLGLTRMLASQGPYIVEVWIISSEGFH